MFVDMFVARSLYRNPFEPANFPLKYNGKLI